MRKGKVICLSEPNMGMYRWQEPAHELELSRQSKKERKQKGLWTGNPAEYVGKKPTLRLCVDGILWELQAINNLYKSHNTVHEYTARAQKRVPIIIIVCLWGLYTSHVVTAKPVSLPFVWSRHHWNNSLLCVSTQEKIKHTYKGEVKNSTLMKYQWSLV